jgi:D-glycero-D-manno-heptose 1,7-bisphosphate phosphatase
LLKLDRRSLIHGRLFLFDLDDTLVANSSYSKTHANLDWLPSSKLALQELSKYPINIAIVTNQSSISKGIFTDLEVLQGLEEFLNLTENQLIKIDSIYICPHQDSDRCSCRKPKPGLIAGALMDFEMDAIDVRLFGNSERDVLAGTAAGVKSFLVSPGNLHEAVLKEI